MFDTVKVLVNGETMEVTVKPLTLFFHDDSITLDVEDAYEISPEFTVDIANHLTTEEWEVLSGQPYFIELWQLVFKAEPPCSLGTNLAYKHITGLILSVFVAISLHKRPFLRLPETYLHPSSQLGLADMIIKLLNLGE